MIAMIGTSDRLCWLAETCKILLLLQEKREVTQVPVGASVTLSSILWPSGDFTVLREDKSCAVLVFLTPFEALSDRVATDQSVRRSSHAHILAAS